MPQIVVDDDTRGGQQDLPGDARQYGAGEQIARGDDLGGGQSKGRPEQPDVDQRGQHEKQCGQWPAMDSKGSGSAGQRAGPGLQASTEKQKSENAEGPQLVSRKSGPIDPGNVPHAVH